MDEKDWLRISQWNETKENIILVHGYAGGDDTLPNDVLRDGRYFTLFYMFFNHEKT